MRQDYARRPAILCAALAMAAVWMPPSVLAQGGSESSLSVVLRGAEEASGPVAEVESHLKRALRLRYDGGDEGPAEVTVVSAEGERLGGCASSPMRLDPGREVALPSSGICADGGIVPVGSRRAEGGIRLAEPESVRQEAQRFTDMRPLSIVEGPAQRQARQLGSDVLAIAVVPAGGRLDGAQLNWLVYPCVRY